MTTPSGNVHSFSGMGGGNGAGRTPALNVSIHEPGSQVAESVVFFFLGGGLWENPGFVA